MVDRKGSFKWPFPFAYTFRAHLDGLGEPQWVCLDYVRSVLQFHGAQNISSDGMSGTVTFHNPSGRFMIAGRATASIDQGQFKIEESGSGITLTYRYVSAPRLLMALVAPFLLCLGVGEVLAGVILSSILSIAIWWYAFDSSRWLFKRITLELTI